MENILINDIAFETIFHHAAIGILVVEPDGIVEMANPFLEKMFGYEEDELCGASLNQLIPEGYRQSHSKHVIKYFESPRTMPMGPEMELWGLRKDGSQFPVEIGLAFFKLDGKYKAVALVVDISERTELKKEIEQRGKNLRLILDHAPSSIAMFDNEMRYLEVSKRWLEDFQMPGKNVIGLSHYDIFPEIPDRWKELHRRTLAGEVLSCEEDPFPRADGRTDWVKWEMTPWHTTSGAIGGLIIFSEVITKRKEAQDAMLAAEKRYRLIYEGIDESFLVQEAITDESGKIVDLKYVEVNSQGEKFLGKSRDELIGHKRSEILGPIDADGLEITNKVILNHEKITVERYLPTVDKWIIAHNYSPQPGQIASLTLDITARKKAEAKQKEESDLLKFFNDAINRLWNVSHLKDGLNEILSTSMKLLRANLGNVQLVDYTKQRLVIAAQNGFNQDFLNYIGKQPINSSLACGMAYSKRQQIVIDDIGKDPNYAEHVQIAGDSGYRTVVATPLLDREGMPIAIVSIHSPIAGGFSAKDLQRMELYAKYAESFVERIKAHETIEEINRGLEAKVKERTGELADALARANEVNELKTAFVSMASHEFRTPLAGILSSVSLAEKYTKSDQQAQREKHFGRIKASVKNLTDILNDFLSVDKLEHAEIKAVKEKFSLKTFMQALTEEVEAIRKPDQSISYVNKGGDYVFLDQKIFHNVILNLVSNAIKYSDKNIDIETELTDSVMILKVADKGIGIPAEQQKNIFNKFFRAKNTSNIEGTGLGLNIVKHYVSLLDGNIEFTSEENKGTVFTVTLPTKI